MKNKEEITQEMVDEELAKWIVATILPWEQHRKDNYEPLWEQIYREWKGIWISDDKTRDSERSRFISPALGQAIEVAVSDMEEATFNRRYWFDMDDDIADQEKQDMAPIRNQLIEDMELAKVPSAISETYLNGALFGTGIGKVIVSEITEVVTENGQPVEKDRIEVPLEPIIPFEFVIDPSARSVNEGLGCAHIPVKPKIDIINKQKEGIYNDVDLGDFVDDKHLTRFGEKSSSIMDDKTEIIEYHGLVPSVFLIDPEEDEITQDLAGDIFDPDESDMVEAIVTISNRSALLRKIANPFTRRDRSIIAYQHDTVPNRFWGRGIGEKGMSSQRALNAELRARQDGLALTIHPMMAMDATKIPRGFKPKVAPGANLLSNGDPSQTYKPMHFGDMSSHTYTEAGELERMLSMATGQMDSAVPISQAPRNQTLGGMSMMQAGSVKRNKRTMRNIEIDFLKPLIDKTAWRYQQFDPERYPFKDYKLLPYSTMGMMARELEQSQIANILNVIPDGPAKGVLLQEFINNTSISVKQRLEAAIAETFNQKPDPVAEQIKQLQLQNAMLTNQNLKADTGKKVSETVENYAQAESKTTQTKVNHFNAIAQVEDKELDRQAFGRDQQ